MHRRLKADRKLMKDFRFVVFFLLFLELALLPAQSICGAPCLPPHSVVCVWIFVPVETNLDRLRNFPIFYTRKLVTRQGWPPEECKSPSQTTGWRYRLCGLTTGVCRSCTCRLLEISILARGFLRILYFRLAIGFYEMHLLLPWRKIAWNLTTIHPYRRLWL